MIRRTLHIAGEPIELRAGTDAAGLLDARYGAFAGAAVAHAAVIELRLRRPRDGDPLPPADLRAARDPGGRLVLRAPGMSAVIAADGARAVLDAPRAERPIDAVVRAVLALRLLERGGLLVHASAVAIGGAAFVFAGASGAGKSTLARELRGDVLSDEAVAVVPAGAGAVAHATPYWRARPASAPVGAVLFPERGPTSWHVLAPAVAAARLLACAGPLAAADTGRALSACASLVTRLPAARISMSAIAEIRAWLQPRLEAFPPLA